MKDEQRMPSTFNVPDIQKLIVWKPKSYCDRRLHTILLTLLTPAAGLMRFSV